MSLLDGIIRGGTVVAAIGGIGAGYYALDQTYARQEQVVAIDQRLEQKIVGDRFFRLQQAYWALEDRYGKSCVQGDAAVKQQCRAILQQLQEAQDELDQLRKK